MLDYPDIDRSRNLVIGEICTRNVVVAEKDYPIHRVAIQMRQHRVGSVVVVVKENKGNKPTGIFTETDLVVNVIAEEIDVNSVSLGEVMSSQLVTAHADDNINEALARMRVKGIHHLPVINAEGYLAGIFTISDLLKILPDKLGDLSLLFRKNGKQI